MLLKVFLRLLIPPRIFWNYVREGSSIAFQNTLPVVVMNSLFLIITFLTYFSLMFLVFQIAYEREVQNLLLGYLSLPIISFFVCSLIRFHIALVRKSQIKMDLFLIDYRKYFNILVLFTLYYSLYVLLIKVVYEISEYDGLLKTRIAVGVVVFFWLVVRLIFSPYYVIDKGYNARKSLKASFLLTSGRTVKTFLLLFFSIFILSVVFLPIAFGLFHFSLYALNIIRTNPDSLNLFLWVGVFAIVSIFLISILAYFFSLSQITFVMSFDINLKNKFSRRKKIIYEAAIETKKQLEDTGFFNALPPSEEENRDVTP